MCAAVASRARLVALRWRGSICALRDGALERGSLNIEYGPGSARGDTGRLSCFGEHEHRDR